LVPSDVGAEEVVDVPEDEGEDLESAPDEVELEAGLGVLRVRQVEVHEDHGDDHEAVKRLKRQILRILKSCCQLCFSILGANFVNHIVNV
jgi:hypothetical protein